MSGALRHTLADSHLSHADLERSRRREWEQFYAELHETPVPRTYRDAFALDVDVTDGVGRWRGLEDWSAHEREAVQLGVRATIVGLAASQDITILEIDFANPAWAADHCPPRSTFVHRLSAGRSQRLDIHYVCAASLADTPSVAETRSDRATVVAPDPCSSVCRRAQRDQRPSRVEHAPTARGRLYRLSE